MRTKRILFFYPSFNISSNQIQQAVSLEYAAFLSALGYKCLYLATEGDADSCRETEQMIKERYGIGVLITQHQGGNIPFCSKLKVCKDAFKQKEKEIVSFDPTHVFTSSSIDFLEASKLARKNTWKTVHLIEGVAPEEAQLSKGRRGLYYWALKYLEHKVLKSADVIILVSNKLRERYKKFRLQESYVIPCCLPEKKNHATNIKLDRQAVGFKETNKVICYLGGLSKWQRVDDIITLFKEIYSLDDNFRFLFIVRQKDLLNDKLRKAKLNPDSYHVTSCKPSEVTAVLPLADAGIIMRHNILVNNVASPIKLPEYLASGLPVILTGGIGDMSELVARENVGCLLDDSSMDASSVIKYINTLEKDQIQQDCRIFVKKYLSWSSYEDQFHGFMD
jgi:glycosyltransferase involved in cell wall biosynthesis